MSDYAVCSADGCGLPIAVKGMCRRHYHSHWRATSEPTGWCSIAGCDRRVKAKGLCDPHHLRALRGLPVNVPLRLPRPFWDWVDRSGDGCWEWQGQRNEKGYGYWRGKRAHRHSWEQANGVIPAGMFVMHVCDNPPCVRPDHLAIGTAADNTADMLAKGRNRRRVVA